MSASFYKQTGFTRVGQQLTRERDRQTDRGRYRERQREKEGDRERERQRERDRETQREREIQRETDREREVGQMLQCFVCAGRTGSP